MVRKMHFRVVTPICDVLNCRQRDNDNVHRAFRSMVRKTHFRVMTSACDTRILAPDYALKLSNATQPMYPSSSPIH
jgi:hypothetical protein